MADPTDVELWKAQEAVVSAVFFRAHTDHQRYWDTAGGSAQNDYASDLLDEAFDGLSKLVAARQQHQVIRRLRETLKAANNAADYARSVAASAAAGRDEFDALHVARGKAGGLAAAVETVMTMEVSSSG